MTGFIKHWRIGWLVVIMVITTNGLLLADDPGNKVINPSKVDPTELLEIDPIDETNVTVSDEMIQSEPVTKSKDDDHAIYPVKEWKPTSSSVLKDESLNTSNLEGEIIKANLLSPYYFSAYIPEIDKTEVDLGLVLSQHPGIDVALAWGAMKDLMAAAKMSVHGASYTAGIRLSYLLRPELVQETKPGLAAVFGWRVQNFRNDDEERTTIFRGNRLFIGAIASKDLGSLATSLDADKAIADFMRYFRVHVQAMAEFQTGRINITEDELARLEFGIKSALEIVIDPERLYLHFIYQSLSDFINGQDQYVAVRFYPRKDFALDVNSGWFGNQLAVNLGLAWIF